MTTSRKALVGLLAIGTIGMLTAISSPSVASPPAAGWSYASAASLAQHPGKVLAGNCFQCHGTDGIAGPFEGIAGKSAGEIYAELKELQGKTTGDEAIMGVHARGYTDAQLRLIADYFASVGTR